MFNHLNMKLGAFVAIGAMGLILIGAGCTSLTNSDPDLGFTMEETGLTGAWIVSDSGYSASYENDDVLTYRTIGPNAGSTGRGATWADVVGYRENEDGQFEYTFNGESWDLFNEDYIDIIGETSLKNGEALVLGPMDCEASPACYSGSGFMAIINTPTGLTPGGVFYSGKTTSLEAFEQALERVSIK
jgi:hypothetical protein